jgi:hypothetical protein
MEYSAIGASATGPARKTRINCESKFSIRSKTAQRTAIFVRYNMGVVQRKATERKPNGRTQKMQILRVKGAPFSEMANAPAAL